MTATSTPVSPEAINALLNGEHGAPFDILGPHPVGADAVAVRAFRPTAQTLTVVNERSGARVSMARLRDEGLFEAVIPAGSSYHYEAVTRDGQHETFADPYSFPSLLTDYDLYLLGEGHHLYTYDKLGAHLHTIDDVAGVRFAVWAPNASRVSVVGNYNHWDARVHPMRLHESSGVWELFIPGLAEGEVYKFDIRSRFNNYQVEKTDPYGFFSELRPHTASIVVDIHRHEWNDDAWMKAREARKSLNVPLSIYEVHLGSWLRKPDGS